MSTRYNTGNPIESTDVRDMSDNAKNFDEFGNSTENSFIDRLGVTRKTIRGMNAEFDYQILNMGFARVGTFATGATLTNPRQVLLWDIADGGDGQEYGWTGVFPKIVPAGSTPLTTGGIAVGAWMSRFDPEMRSHVREALRRSYAEAGYNLVAGSFETGGALVNANDVLLYEASGKAFTGPAGPVAAGTDPASGGFVGRSGELLRSQVQQISGVNYRQYGAKLDGVTDDTSAILACHADANTNGYKIVQSGGIAKIDGITQIVWKVDAEYRNGFHFLCDTISPSLFLIAPEYDVVNLNTTQVNISEFTKYSCRIPSLAAYAGNALFLTDTTATDLIRVGGAIQGKRCVTVVNTNGDLRYPLTTTFLSFDKCMLSPLNIPVITVAGLAVKYTGAVADTLPIKITRNRVRLIEPRYIDASSANIPIYNFISIEFAYDVEVTAPTGDGIGADRVANSYFVNYWTSGNIRIRNMSYDVGWAGTDGNYSRDVLHEDCQADRLGGHYSCWDFTFNNITTSRSRCIEISGGGKLSVDNIKILANPSYTLITPVEIRGDYGAEWDGDIEVNGVTVDARAFTSLASNPVITVLSAITDTSVGAHDFGRRVQLPQSVNIEDVEVLVRREAAGGRVLLRGAVIGHLTGISSETAYPARVVVEDMSLLDGGAPVANALNAVTVFGQPKSAFAPQEIHVSVRGCNNKDPRTYGVNPATSGDNTVSITGNTNQKYRIMVSDCDWFRLSVATQGGAGGSETLAYGTRLAYINGNASDDVSLFGCKIGSTRLSGEFSLSVDSGTLEAFLNVDGITYGQFGFPNNPEQNLRFARGVAIEVNSAIRGTVVTKDLLQVGYFQGSYYEPFLPYRKGLQSPVGNVTPRWVGDEYLDETAGQFNWYKATGTSNTNWKPTT